MPSFNDVVSRFTMSPELQKQEAYSTKCLRWMQDNPEQCKNTTYARMGRTIALSGTTDQKERNIVMTLQNMASRGMITYNGAARGRRKTFFINYLHKNIPKEIIERAPKKDIKQHEDLAGFKLVDSTPKTASEPEKSCSCVSDAPAPVEPTEAVKPEPAVPVPQVQTPAMNVPIELDKMPNGNFTLQLNINFTINSKS